MARQFMVPDPNVTQRYRHRIFLPIAPMAGRISYCPGMERAMPMMQAVIRLCCEEWH